MGVAVGHSPHSGYHRVVSSADVPRGRHRLVEPVRRPSLLPRSAGVVAATVGAVLVLGIQSGPAVPAPRPHPDAPERAASPSSRSSPPRARKRRHGCGRAATGHGRVPRRGAPAGDGPPRIRRLTGTPSARRPLSPLRRVTPRVPQRRVLIVVTPRESRSTHGRRRWTRGEVKWRPIVAGCGRRSGRSGICWARPTGGACGTRGSAPRWPACWRAARP